jgi:hypothetical protein
MKRLFAAVAISALTLSTAAFAADTGAQKPVDQKAPAVTTTTPAKPMADDAKAKKPVVKKEKTSLNAQRPAALQQAQASGSAAVAPSKSTTDGAAPAKKAETVKKSDGKASSETVQPSTTSKPATR